MIPNLPNSSIALSVVRVSVASTIDLMLGSPLFSASATHSSEYPLPLKITLWCSVRYFLVTASIAAALSEAASISSAASLKASATIALRVVLGADIESLEPTIRNSNLLPVNANGDVLLRSVASFFIGVTVLIPRSNLLPSITESTLPFSIICLTISSSWSPRKIEMIAGGAS